MVSTFENSWWFQCSGSNANIQSNIIDGKTGACNNLAMDTLQSEQVIINCYEEYEGW